ncbi:MAG: DPP IV N-terminal domain-containing protein, partial [Chloroflexi bacterium]|nr:DPP IV N-terminal domain-containing protein [Chloroflexota bacterium]
MAICSLGLLLSACGSSVAGLLGGQAPASSPSADAHSLTQTRAATPEPISSPSPTASQTPPPPTPSLSVPTPVNLLLESGTIAYALRRDGRSTVFLLPLGSPDAWPLSQGSDDRDPAFNPQGTALVYASRRDGNWEIYLTDLVNGETRRLTDSPEYDGRPDWSPDGQWVVY